MDREKNNEKEQETNTNTNNKIFVGGLSQNTSDELLLSYFSTFGDVEDALVKRDHFGSSRRFGFVTMATDEGAKRALESDLEIDGRKVDAKLAVPNTQVHGTTQTRKIFVGAIGFDITSADLTEYFSQFGKVEDSTVLMDTQTRRSRGFAFITFEDQKSVENVLMNKVHQLKDKTLDCKRAIPRTSQAITSINDTNEYNPYEFGYPSWAPFYQYNQFYRRNKYGFPNTNNDKNRKLFVGGIPLSTTRDDLFDYFGTIGTVEEVIIMHDNTGKSRGFGFVWFENETDATTALEIKNHLIHEKTIDVKKAIPRHDNDHRVRQNPIMPIWGDPHVWGFSGYGYPMMSYPGNQPLWEPRQSYSNYEEQNQYTRTTPPLDRDGYRQRHREHQNQINQPQKTQNR